MLLTAKPVIYLANLSERDYVRKKNKWLPKIKQWIDENNPGDLLIPFSVALEERMLQEFEDDNVRVEEFTKLNTQGQLGKIMVAGYQALNVRSLSYANLAPVSDVVLILSLLANARSSSDTSLAVLKKSEPGRFGKVPKLPKLPESSTPISRSTSSVVTS
jgi:hypothetical protein